MSFNELPTEIIVRILSFLRPSDRLDCALTCRRWARAFADPALTRDVWFVVERNRIDEAENVLLNSYRQYQNLRFERVCSHNFNAKLWAKVGPRLRKLELIASTWFSGTHYRILHSCCNLESLKIEKAGWIYPSHFKIPPGMNLESIQESMSKLRHLNLDLCTAAAMIEHLVSLMPNVSSIGLVRSDLIPDFMSLLPNILGTNCRITILGLDRSEPNESVEPLRMCSATVQELRIKDPFFTREAFEALGDCTELRHLTMPLNQSINDDLLRNIIRSLPQLESLVLWESPGIRRLTYNSLMSILELKELRELELQELREFNRYCFHHHSSVCASTEFLRRLKEMLSLETFRLHVEISKFNRRFSQSFMSPRDLERLRIVLFDLSQLKSLSISGDFHRKDVTLGEHSEFARQVAASLNRATSDGQEGVHSSSLEVLELRSLPLTNDFLGRIAAHHSRLEHLLLSECNQITDAGLVTLVQREPLLRELRVSHCQSLHGTFLVALEELCPRLRKLEISLCAGISHSAVQSFTLRRPKVRVVHN